MVGVADVACMIEAVGKGVDGAHGISKTLRRLDYLCRGHCYHEVDMHS